ncbi:hypothetical protein N7470_000736 [Penicillium chermesinum]|nr:hypothetical protein N7470_000736 [Penicillium chermesinum]
MFLYIQMQVGDNKGLGSSIPGGDGFPFSLDSFNGLELRDSVMGDEEGDVFELDKGGVNVGTSQPFYIPSDVIKGPHGNWTKKLPPYLDSNNQTVPPDQVGWLRKREKRDGTLEKRTTTVYLSLTQCTRPSTNKTNAAGLFPQLEVYVSTSNKLQLPGPGKDSSLQTVATASAGYLSMEIEADDNVYISVAAPNSTDYQGNYGFHIAASIDDYFFKTVELEEDQPPVLYFLDSDQNAALLVTNNLTQANEGSDNFNQWMNMTPPYMMWAQNTNNTDLDGLEMSVCALNGFAKVKSNAKDDVTMTSRGLGNKPKQQFYLLGLNSSSTYYGTLGTAQNASNNLGFTDGEIGGGGTVWSRMNFTTKIGVFPSRILLSEGRRFPSNPNKTVEELRQIYDNYTSTYYQNFNYSLQQIQCHADPESMFSLSVDCDKCAQAYKQWLCSVSIPRCADFSSNDSYKHVRNAAQAFINGSHLPEDSPYRQEAKSNYSRNAIIDTLIKPGPYREILPCTDICYTMVKDCPAALQFGCPTGALLNASYGYRNSEGIITCSYLGAAYYLSLGARLGIWGGFYMLAGMWALWWALW